MTTGTKKNRLKKTLFAGIHNSDLKDQIEAIASGKFDTVFVETTGEGKGLLKTDAINTIDAIMLDISAWPGLDIDIKDVAKASGGFVTLLSRSLDAKTPVIVTCKDAGKEDAENPVMDLINKMIDHKGNENVTVIGPIIVNDLPTLLDKVLDKTNFESKIVTDEVEASAKEQPANV